MITMEETLYLSMKIWQKCAEIYARDEGEYENIHILKKTAWDELVVEVSFEVVNEIPVHHHCPCCIYMKQEGEEKLNRGVTWDLGSVCIQYCPGMSIWSEGGKNDMNEAWTVPCEYRGPYHDVKKDLVDYSHKISIIAKKFEDLYNAYVKTL